MNNEEVKDWVVHIDGDAFFASVEQSRRPELWNKPVVVGQERGIATALSYEAKKLGIKRGDLIFKIKEQYPEVVVLSSHFELYNKYSLALINIVKDQVKILENYSIDECFAIISCSRNGLHSKIKALKERVQKKLGITYSFGVATTKALAKIASKRNKPDGLYILIDKAEIIKVLKDTQIDNVWGLGPATCQKLKTYKYKTAFDFISKTMPPTLTKMLSKNILEVKNELLGIQRMPVIDTRSHKKSIQASRSFAKTNNKHFIYSELSRNLEMAVGELVKDDLYTDRVIYFVKIVGKVSPYATEGAPTKIISKEYRYESHTQNFMTLSSDIHEFIEQLFDNDSELLIKSTGIVLTNLLHKKEIPVSLFSSYSRNNTQDVLGNIQSNLDQKKQTEDIVDIVTNLQSRYGFATISMASSLCANKIREAEKEKRDEDDNYEYGLPYKFLGVIV